MTKQIKTITRRAALARTSAAALCVAVLSSACGGPDEGELVEDATESAIVGGTVDNRNLYPAVVRIEMKLPGGGMGSCTATAISHYALLTAAHCVYINGYVEYVKVVNATGSNKTSVGSTSTQIILHNAYKKRSDESSYSESHVAVDMAIVIFGSNVFDVTARTGMVDFSEAGDAVTLVGFTGTETRSYRKLGNWGVKDATVISANDILEGGDSGGPWIVNVNGTARVVGISSGRGFAGPKSKGFFISKARQEGLVAFLQGTPDYCITGYLNKSHTGPRWSFCNRDAVNNKFGKFTASDTFTMVNASHNLHWKEKISSTKAGNKVKGKYYDQGSCRGTLWWINDDADLSNNLSRNLNNVLVPANDRIACAMPVLR